VCFLKHNDWLNGCHQDGIKVHQTFIRRKCTKKHFKLFGAITTPYLYTLLFGIYPLHIRKKKDNICTAK
jgi:hypothetical protein